MINYIIYEDDKKYREKYISIILKMIGKNNDDYSITEFSKYDREVQKIVKSPGKKIYILDIEVPGKSGLDLAREIRNSNDWESQIIIVTNHDNLQLTTFTSRLLTLDFISKYNDLANNLKESLLTSYTILTSYKSLKVKSNGELYQIFYNDINYISKNADDIDVKIYLKDGSYQEVNDSLNKLEQKLKGDLRFFRTHRGCIVNITQIKSVDFNTDTIKFENGSTPLLARDRKKNFKDYLCENQIILESNIKSKTKEPKKVSTLIR